MSKGKWLLVAVIAAAVASYFMFDLGQYLSLDYFKSRQAEVMAYYAAHQLETVAAFFLIYVALCTVPSAWIITVVAGAIFGVLWGMVIVSFASSIGATLAMLASRYLFRDIVQNKFGDRLVTINKGIEKDGIFYLITLRLVPAFPFYLINLTMGLTPMRAWTFYWVSQLSMLPGTFVFVYAGTQIATIKSTSDILSPGLLLAFVLLGVFPLIAKKMVDVVKANKVYAHWRSKRPKTFDNNVVVIGAGSAGLVTSYIAAAVKAKVTLIEKHRMGGDCLNTGCVPSKALIRSAKFMEHIRRAEEFGMQSASVEMDFADVMERVQKIIKVIEPHDSIERYSGLGVSCITGNAKITSPWTVEVNGETLTTRNIVIAAGARPFVPPIKGIDQVKVWTSDNVWEMRELPKRLCVLGGGPIGSELTQAFARLGAKVTQIEMLPRILIREDPEVAELVQKRFEAEGIDVLTGHKAKEIRVINGQKIIVCEYMDAEVLIDFDELLCAVGRVANLKGYGLEELGVEVGKTVTVNDFLQTNYPNIFACGDVAGPYQFTHTAAHQAWYASVNALFGGVRKFKADYSVIPWATFTEPEVARVGLNELEAKEKGVPYEVTTYHIDDLDRAIADSEGHGVVKVLTVPGKDKILGVTIAGEHAGDLIAEYILAMRHGLGLNKI
ncbi:MAG: FAD-dependent oxidoreductase, partial [Nevskiales bacterium]